MPRHHPSVGRKVGEGRERAAQLIDRLLQRQAVGGKGAEVRPPDIAGKQEIAGEEHPGSVGQVQQFKGHALAGMARGVANDEIERAHAESSARTQSHDFRARSQLRPRHPRQFRALCAEVGADRMERGKPAHAAHEIRVHMGLGNGNDAHAFGGGDLEVAVNVAGRIDHDRLLRRSTCHEVRGLRKLRVVNPAEQHGVSLTKECAHRKPDELRDTVACDVDRCAHL